MRFQPPTLRQGKAQQTKDNTCTIKEEKHNKEGCSRLYQHSVTKDTVGTVECSVYAEFHRFVGFETVNEVHRLKDFLHDFGKEFVDNLLAVRR